MHDVKRLRVRHLLRFQSACRNGICTGLELVFKACNLLWDRDLPLYDMSFPANPQAGGIDKIVKDQVAGSACYDPLVDDFGGIYTCGCTDAGGAEVPDGAVAVHAHKVEQIYPKVQQGTAAQFRALHPFLPRYIIR